MKTAVGYSRYSSISQGDGSTIQTQQEAIKEYCYAHNMNLLKHYSDLAISGKDTEHRTQFKEMIQDITLGEINAVVVYTRDRFSRSIKDFIKYLQIMSDYNCELYVVKENGDVNTPSGQLSAWILMSLAEYYIKNLNREVIRGLRYNAHHCLWNGSVLPFGYDKDKSGRLIINDGEANIVRIIYNLYLQDYSPKEIELYLKDKEYHRKDGREILHSTVEKVLKRRTYLGEYSYNIKAGDNPEEIIIPDGVPRIIEDDIFEQVQNKILERSKKIIYNHSDIEKGLLVGKIKCGYTGFNMICSASKVNMELRTENSYYTCCTKKKHTKLISQRDIDDLVSLMLSRIILDKKYINSIEKYLNKYVENTKKFYSKQYDDSYKHYEDLKSELNDVISMVASGKEKNIDMLLAKIKTLQEEINGLESLLAVSKMRIENINKLVVRELSDNIDELYNKFKTNRKSVVKRLINEVVVYDEYIRIKIDLKDLINISKSTGFYSNNVIYTDILRKDITKITNDILYHLVSFDDLLFRRSIE